MAVFGKKEQVLKTEGLRLGEFDPSAHGFYRNVQTFPVRVKKRRVVRICIASDISIDIAVANERGESVYYKQAVKDTTVGPVPTGDNKEMGIIIGISPGDRATVSIEAWMEKQ
jgi:hypothetical protein